GRAPGQHTKTCNRPWRSSSSGYAPQIGETSARGREDDIAAVRSPGGRPPDPCLVEGQTCGHSTCGRHYIEVLHRTRKSSSDESNGRTVGREGGGIIDLLA